MEIRFKQKNRPRMNYERIGKTNLEKKSDPKKWNTVKTKMKLPHVNKKTTSEKANFCSNTVFSLYFEFRAKNFTPQNHSLFRSTSGFGVTKITSPIWLQKSRKCVNRSLKKDSTPIKLKFFDL